MKVDLRVDAATLTINTRNPDTLARWLIEQFEFIDWNPATWCQVYVWPTFDRAGKIADWICDTRYLYPEYTVKSPRELLERLTERLDYYEGRDKSE